MSRGINEITLVVLVALACPLLLPLVAKEDEG
jgi:hypothetical protein